MVGYVGGRKHIGIKSHFVHAADERKKSGIIARADLPIEQVIRKVRTPPARSNSRDAINVKNKRRTIERRGEMVPLKRLNWDSRSLRERTILHIEYPVTGRPW